MVDTTKEINQAAILAENEALRKEIEKLKQCKRYGLVWEDHPEALDKKNIIPLLAKDDGLSLPVIADKKQNYLIEGDNYHALKALQHTHRSAIDVIYIDPPYNTGSSDFIYNDTLVDDEDAFRHSKWLSFMEKRLKLARELMDDDGFIAISIDDNELYQLKLLCDSIFGEKNQIAIPKIHMRNPNRQLNAKSAFQNSMEYMLIYAKNITAVNVTRQIERVDFSQYKYKVIETGPGEKRNINGKTVYVFQKDEYIIEKCNDLNDPFIVKPISIRGKIKTAQNSGKYYENNLRPLMGTDSDGSLYKVMDMGSDGIGHRYFTHPTNKTINGTYYQGVPTTQRDDIAGATKEKSWSDYLDFIEPNIKAGNVLKEMFNNKIFSTPKPLDLMAFVLNLHPNKSATVLDFFAGSGTTGHAVMELNKEDGGNRNFILCTNNEVSDDLVRTHFFNEGHITKNNKTEFNKFVKEHPDVHETFLNSVEYESLGIARAVTRERIKRVIEGYTTPKGKDVEGLPNNLMYLKTKEFDKKEQYGFDRNILANLAYNSHMLKYPELNYESFQVDAFTDIDAIKLTTSKQPVAFVNTRDRESLADIVEQLTSHFGNKVIIETLESYFN